jgi:hypothetical protein
VLLDIQTVGSLVPQPTAVIYFLSTVERGFAAVADDIAELKNKMATKDDIADVKSTLADHTKIPNNTRATSPSSRTT